MVLAEIGPLTSSIESVGTAVAAGTLLGSFVIGTAGLLAGISREALTARVLTDGYSGGVFAAAAVLIDLALR
jgi:hypothetical protein